MNTRSRIKALGAIAVGLVSPAIAGRHLAAAHQDHATPAAALTDLDLPVLDLVFTLESIEGMPESIEAGRYLVRITGEAGEEDFALSPLFLQLPEGTSMDDAMAEAQAATDAPPAFFYTSVIAGGKGLMPMSGDTEALSIVELTEGEWLLAGGALSRPPMPFTVTPGSVGMDVEPGHTVVLEMDEMLFRVAEGEFCACENVIKLVNAGAQPHFAEIMLVPDGTTNDQIAETIASEMTGTPAANPLDFSAVQPVAYLSEQSTGVTSWCTLTLEPGTYAMMCWIPDPETGIPHAMSGMHDVFVVTA